MFYFLSIRVFSQNEIQWGSHTSSHIHIHTPEGCTISVQYMTWLHCWILMMIQLIIVYSFNVALLNISMFVLANATLYRSLCTVLCGCVAGCYGDWSCHQAWITLCLWCTQIFCNMYTVMFCKLHTFVINLRYIKPTWCLSNKQCPDLVEVQRRVVTQGTDGGQFNQGIILGALDRFTILVPDDTYSLFSIIFKRS